MSKYRAAQLEELPKVVEHARALVKQNRQLELELQKRAHTIAALEAKLTERAASAVTETEGVQEPVHLHQELAAPTTITEFESPQPMDEANARTCAGKSVNDEVAIAQRSVEQCLEERVAASPEPPQDETEVQWLQTAPIDELEAVIHKVPMQSAYKALNLLNLFQSADTKRISLVEQYARGIHVTIGAAEPTAEPSSKWDNSLKDSVETIDAYQSEYLEPVEEQDDYLIEPEEQGETLLGGSWENSPNHLVEEHQEFIDDVDQEVRSLQPVGAVTSRKAFKAPDIFGDFDF